MEKKNFIENQISVIKNLYLDAVNFYMQNVKDEEMKMVDEYIFDGNYPPFYKYNRENVENWLMNDRYTTIDFINKFSDNLSVMAFINMNKIGKAL